MTNKTESKVRTTSVTIVDRKGNESKVVVITFNDISDLIQKIQNSIESTGYRKVDVSVDCWDFTQEEIDMLNSYEIF